MYVCIHIVKSVFSFVCTDKGGCQRASHFSVAVIYEKDVDRTCFH